MYDYNIQLILNVVSGIYERRDYLQNASSSFSTSHLGKNLVAEIELKLKALPC